MNHPIFPALTQRPKRRRIRALATGLLAGVLLSACTTGAWYEGMKTSAQQECERQAPGAREDCLSRLNQKSYDAYSKERAPLVP